MHMRNMSDFLITLSVCSCMCVKVCFCEWGVCSLLLLFTVTYCITLSKRKRSVYQTGPLICTCHSKVIIVNTLCSKSIHANGFVWSKTTLIIGSFGGVGAVQIACKLRKLFAIPLELRGRLEKNDTKVFLYSVFNTYDYPFLCLYTQSTNFDNSKMVNWVNLVQKLTKIQGKM